MSNKNILRVLFEPNIGDLAEILPKSGFQRLTDSTPADLPSGAVVIIYNSRNHSLGSIVICEHHHNGFSYMHFNHLNRDYAPDIKEMNRNYDFKGQFYKVLLHLPEVNPNPGKELLRKLFAEAGFKNLAEATPDDLPQGCVVIIANRSCKFTPAIVRVLSMSNRRFLYLRQSGIVAGQWESGVIMDDHDHLQNYSYLVIS